MSKFLDGPAEGVVLELRRAPFMLRAVRKGDKWDALDQAGDEANPDEEIFVYRLTAEATRVHLCRSPRRLSGWIALGEYRLLPEQPEDKHVRTTKAWQDWCDANKVHLIAGTWAEKAEAQA